MTLPTYTADGKSYCLETVGIPLGTMQSIEVCLGSQSVSDGRSTQELTRNHQIEIILKLKKQCICVSELNVYMSAIVQFEKNNQ